MSTKEETKKNSKDKLIFYSTNQELPEDVRTKLQRAIELKQQINVNVSSLIDRNFRLFRYN